MILVIHLPCLFVVTGKHHLGATTHTKGGTVGVQGLCGKTLTLGQDITVQIGQYRRIETDIILHQEDDLHTRLMDIVLQIHLILNQLDDREDEVRITQPTEDIVEDAHILVLHPSGDTVREGREHHDGYLGEVGLDIPGHVKGIIIRVAGHTHHQIDAFLAEHLGSLLGGGYLRERRRIAQSEFGIFIEDLLIHTSVVLQHKGIVGVGHDKHLEDTVRHQIDERHIF